MDLSTVECQKRPAESKARALRREGLLPATLYGHNGTESVQLVMNAKDADTLIRKVGTKRSLIQLNIPDMSWNGEAYIQEVQTHPWRGFLYHISFYAPSATS